MPPTPVRVAVVGAGIGGLAAAHHLTRLAAERGLALEVVVLEASERPGGWLATERCEGALLERGPDTLVTHKPAGLALCRKLGLGDRLVFRPVGRIDILDRGRLRPLPAGFALAVPTRARPLLTSPLLSIRGKLRALAEPWMPARPAAAGGSGEPADESVAAYVRRRFGDELHRRIAEPVMGGLFMADTEELSLAASFPRLVEHRRASTPARPGPPGPGASPGPPGASRNAGQGPTGASHHAGQGPPPAATLEGGLGQIVPALVDHLPAGSLRLGQRVQGLAREGRGYVLQLEDGPLAAEAVLIALPAPAAANLLAGLDPALAAGLGQIAYASAVTVHLAWPRAAVARPPQCHGFFVPRTAGLPVVAASFVSDKYPERAPADQLVIRVYLGGALHPESIGQPDTELVERAARTLQPLLGIHQPPLWSQVWRHPAAMPQRRVGHPALVARLQARLQTHPGLDFTGGPLGAYGLPDSIAAGEAAAERVVNSLER